MIRYALRCDGDHAFEAWFGASADYDDQAARGLVECPLLESVGDDMFRCLEKVGVTVLRIVATFSGKEWSLVQCSTRVDSESLWPDAALCGVF